MASKQLTKSSTGWSATESQTSTARTYKFTTKDLYVTGDIKMTINIPGVELGVNESFWIKDPNGITWTFTIDSNGNMRVV